MSGSVGVREVAIVSPYGEFEPPLTHLGYRVRIVGTSDESQ